MFVVVARLRFMEEKRKVTANSDEFFYSAARIGVHHDGFGSAFTDSVQSGASTVTAADADSRLGWIASVGADRIYGARGVAFCRVAGIVGASASTEFIRAGCRIPAVLALLFPFLVPLLVYFRQEEAV